MSILAPVVLFACLLALFVSWLFFWVPPRYADKRALKVFNNTMLALCGIFSLAYIYNIAVFIPGPQLQSYRVAFSLGGIGAIVTVFLGVMFLLRNFWIFRPKNPGGFY